MIQLAVNNDIVEEDRAMNITLHSNSCESKPAASALVTVQDDSDTVTVGFKEPTAHMSYGGHVTYCIQKKGKIARQIELVVDIKHDKTSKLPRRLDLPELCLA